MESTLSPDVSTRSPLLSDHLSPHPPGWCTSQLVGIYYATDIPERIYCLFACPTKQASSSRMILDWICGRAGLCSIEVRMRILYRALALAPQLTGITRPQDRGKLKCYDLPKMNRFYPWILCSVSKTDGSVSLGVVNKWIISAAM